MTTKAHQPALLYRIDHARNMARFYSLSIEPTLFGTTMLVRTWGRIGSSGRTRFDTFDHASDAAVLLEAIAGAKRRKGYAPRPAV